MKYLYAGTDDFSARVLEKLAESYGVPEAVLTQKPKPKGRGLKVLPTPVATKAALLAVPVFEIESFAEIREKSEQFSGFDALVVCSFGLYVPSWFTKLFRWTLNFHPSLLPDYRGAAPIQRALLDGRKVTGVSIIEVAEEMDAGRIYDSVEVKIEEGDNFATLSEKLVEKGVPLLADVMRRIESGSVTLSEQTGVPTYARKIDKEELWIDWNDSSEEILNRIRAFSPSPGARTMFRNKMLKIIRAERVEGEAREPGRIVRAGKEGITVETGKGLISILEVQPENSGVMSARDFVNGYRVRTGEFFMKKN